jgi:hypothetical protein
MIEQNQQYFFTNDLNRERIMNITKNAKGELCDGVQKREKWVKYLMQHLHKKTPPQRNIIINPRESNCIKMK